MKIILAALVAAPVLLTGIAAAETPLGESQFIRANRCVAYASLPVLQNNAVDLTTVKARIADSRSRQSMMTVLSVQSLTRDAQAKGAAASSTASIDGLLARRDRYCGPFVDATQLAARAGTTSQQ